MTQAELQIRLKAAMYDRESELLAQALTLAQRVEELERELVERGKESNPGHAKNGGGASLIERVRAVEEAERRTRMPAGEAGAV
jgi:hypothetical protein